MVFRRLAALAALSTLLASGCVNETTVPQIPDEGMVGDVQVNPSDAASDRDVPHVSGGRDMAVLEPDLGVIVQPDQGSQPSDASDPSDRVVNPEPDQGIEVDASVPEPDALVVEPDVFVLPPPDTDGDGVADPDDCQPRNATVFPGAPEICDNLDSNCDGFVGETIDDMTQFWLDDDGDGEGDPLVTMFSCFAPIGYVANANDCNDANAAVNSVAVEICDGTDNNCNDDIDEGTLIVIFPDPDGDDAGSQFVSEVACALRDGFVLNDFDCDDGNPLVFTGAPEICDGFDNDCNGEADEGLAHDYVLDADGDGFGDRNGQVVSACAAPPSHVNNVLDCNDRNGMISPAAQEVCDEDNVDEDCDGSADNEDESALEETRVPVYPDADGDGFGNPIALVLFICDVSEGFVLVPDDCNDDLASVNPDGVEVCDGVDNDCDGEIDEEATDRLTWYRNADGDEAGDPNVTLLACDQPDGYLPVPGDCNDQDIDIQNGGAEICDGDDNDCNGLVDDGEGVLLSSYADLDRDGYGDGSTLELGCTIADGRVMDDTDCDDENRLVNPGMREVCDIFNVDEDCNGSADDEDPTVARGSLNTFFANMDGDLHGDPNEPVFTCDLPEGAAVSDRDCDDTNANVNPEAVEVCDNVDNNCDGDVDEGVLRKWYKDADLDFCPEADEDHVFTTMFACEQPEGFLEAGDLRIICGLDLEDPRGDCDDDDAEIYPNADEFCNGVDDDCDGVIDNDPVDPTTWYRDADGDEAGDPNVTLSACDQPDGYIAVPGDCDDADNDTRDSRPEVCDGEDNDCDGVIDNGVLTASYLDLDGDRHGDTLSEELGCGAVPLGRTDVGGDCDDGNILVHPNAREACNGIDDNCDGQIDETLLVPSYDDADGDGFGEPDTMELHCDVPPDRADNDLDCNDQNAGINPDATEVCDELLTDENCNESSDDQDQSTDPDSKQPFGFDIDGDHFGDANNIVMACHAPARTIPEITDCDDRFVNVHPGAVEVENRIDDDCDGVIDEGTNAFDDDGDGYSENAGDCNDADATMFPDQRAEICDGLDNDCDFTVDDHVGQNAHRDDDGDGHGWSAPTNIWVCNGGVVPQGYSLTSDDCDDEEVTIYPGAFEVCNSMDDNCNGLTDDEAIDATVWSRDADTDGFGNADITREACVQPQGWVLDNTDCNDRNHLVYPGADETCNQRDDNCNGTIDEGVTRAYFPDRDGDREGDRNVQPVNGCLPPAQFVENNDDCDDQRAAVNTRAIEVCDGMDNNCNGDIDEGLTVRKCVDADRDGFGDRNAVCVMGCAAPGFVDNVLDCDDRNNTVRPGGLEICDGLDNDCDGFIDAQDPNVRQADVQTAYVDADGDDYGDSRQGVVFCRLDPVPEGLIFSQGDCNDGDATVHPDAPEVCGSNVDRDCDGTLGNQDTCIDEGTYTGTFQIHVFDPRFGRPQDTCTGTMTFTVSVAQEHTIMGQVSCVYDVEGDFAAAFPQGHQGTMTADVVGGLNAWGSVTLVGWDWDFFFQGLFSDPDVLTGTFEQGQNRLDGHRFTYEGLFNAIRDP